VRQYCSHVWQKMEYTLQAWCPYTASDKEALELVQKRVIDLVVGLRDRNYEEKLVEYSGGWIKWTLHGLTSQPTEPELVLPQLGRTSQVLDLESRKARTELSANFFSLRVTTKFNNLLDGVRSA
jgi:hypothetical protein